MIKNVHIYPRFVIQGIRDDRIKVSQSYLDDGWALISIYTEPSALLLTPAAIEKFKSLGCKDYMTEMFIDTVPELYPPILEKYPESVLCDTNHAKRIFQFLKDIHMKDIKTLVVHCDMGISRSGAIGTFANDFFGLSYLDFIHTNPQITPNRWVYQLLKEEANMEGREIFIRPNKSNKPIDHDSSARIQTGLELANGFDEWISLV